MAILGQRMPDQPLHQSSLSASRFSGYCRVLRGLSGCADGLNLHIAHAHALLDTFLPDAACFVCSFRFLRYFQQSFSHTATV